MCARLAAFSPLFDYLNNTEANTTEQIYEPTNIQLEYRVEFLFHSQSQSLYISRNIGVLEAFFFRLLSFAHA